MPIPIKEVATSRVSAKELVLNVVQDWIVSGILKPGEKIVDAEIAKYFSVSRTPVREALQCLSERGMVEVVPSCGTRVSEIDWEDIRRCYELIAELQIIAARMSYPLIDNKDFEALRQLNADFAQAETRGTRQDQLQLDALFHGYLIDKFGNCYLKQYIENLLLRIRRVQNLYFKDNMNFSTSVSQHNIIIDALEAGDLSRMESAMRDNWLGSYYIVESHSHIATDGSESI